MPSINFTQKMQQLLKEYGDEVFKTIDEALPKVSKEAVQKLRQTSPRGRTGDYAKGWRWQRVKGERGRFVSAVISGRSPTYRLAHLLEHGHARRGGGRQVPGIEHIRPVEEWVQETFLDEIVKKLS